MANDLDGDIKIGVDLETKSVRQSVNNLRKTIAETFGNRNTATLSKNIRKASQEVKSLEKDIENAKTKLDAIKSGDVVPDSIKKLQQQIKETDREAESLAKRLEQMSSQRSKIREHGTPFKQSISDVKVNGKYFSPEDAATLQGLNADISEFNLKLGTTVQKSDELKLKLDTLQTNPMLTPEAAKYANTVEHSNAQLTKQRAKLKDLEKQQINLNNTQKKSLPVISDITKRIAGLAKRVFFFSMITSAFRTIVDYGKKVVEANAELSASLQQVKGNMQTAFQSIFSSILPALQSLINMLVKVTAYVTAFISLLTGSSVSASKNAAKSLHDQANAAKAAGSASKKAAKDAQKASLSFDELNVISSPDEDAGSAGAGGGAGTETPAPFSSTIDDSIVAKVQSIFDSLMVIVGTGALVLGVILLFTGHAPLGLGMILAGGAMLWKAASENWGSTSAKVSGELTALMVAITASLIVIGAILTFVGVTGIGIGLMAAGAAGLVATVGISWGSISTKVQDEITGLLLILSTVLLVIGVILAFSNVKLALGIALIAAGAAGLAASASLNWEYVKDKLQGTTGAIVAIVSGALLVLGAILAFSGVALPLGIGLMIVGAAGLAAEAAVNWDSIVSALQGPVGAVMAIIGGALVVLGIILLFSGAGIPLGLGLILAGGVSLATAIAPNWNFLKDKVVEIWGNISNWYKGNVAPWFTKKKWVDLVKKIGQGLKQGFKDAINGVITIVENGINFIIGQFNKLSWEVPDWVPKIGGKKWGFDFDKVKIPRLAQGAVIPPNKEFLAVLGDQKRGTNIEAPLETIIQAMKIALGDYEGGVTDVNINFTGNLAQLARLLNPHIEKEKKRRGTKLVKGGAY